MCLIFLIVLSCFYTYVVDSTCPDMCRCMSGSITSVTVCNSANLLEVPLGIPNDTNELILNNNALSILPQDSFIHLPKVYRLIMRKCRINTIEPNAFRGLSNLRELDMKWNLIYQIESFAFSGLPKLRVLLLDYNNIHFIYNFAFFGLELIRLSLEVNPFLEDITMDAFNGSSVEEVSFYNASLTSASVSSLSLLQSSLRQLSIIHNRRPLVVSPYVFQGFKFQSLKLSHSQLKDTFFLRYISVEDLSLSGNDLVHVNFSQYHNLNNVRVLRLEKTQFSEPEGSLFKGLKRLEELHLGSNDIRTLPESMRVVFSRLRVLGLKSNPLHCNCKLSWFQRWVRATTTRVIGARCETPMTEDVSRVSSVDFICSLPHVLTITKRVNAAAYHEVSLTCTAHGDPIPSIIWKTPVGNDIVASPAPKHKNSGENRGVLTIASLQEEDAGLYRCVAANAAGNTSHDATLDVYQVLPRTSSSTGTLFILNTLLCVSVTFSLLHK